VIKGKQKGEGKETVIKGKRKCEGKVTVIKGKRKEREGDSDKG
jgi:hypothetical protein